MNSKTGRKNPFSTREPRSRLKLDIPFTSLMWPNGQPAALPTSATWEGDLGMVDLIGGLSLNTRYNSYVRQMLIALVSDATVIGWRQAVLSDFVRNPSLGERIRLLLPRLAGLGARNELLGRAQRNLLLDTADQLVELESFVELVGELHEALSGAELQSEALIRVRDTLAALAAEPDFIQLRDELPELRAPLERIASLTIGINLDLELRPVSGVLLTINDYKVRGEMSWLERAIGGVNSEAEDSAGIAPLHSTPQDPKHRILSPLFQDLDQLLTQIAQPIARALRRYVRSGSAGLAHLEYELAFFSGAARLIQQLEARGLHCCQPEIAAVDERVTNIEGLVNITLLLREAQMPVANTLEFGAEGRIAVLTGPNSGGKTTFVRAVGLAQVMAQAGLFIPAARARISPVDKILTHFPALETRQHGRLAEEAQRLRDIFQRATRHSLVLLNETFASTSSGEALYLAHDILAALRAMGVRAIYATHLIELAENLAEIEAAAEGDCRLFSLVAGIRVNEEGETVPTFEITRGQPLGKSYAREIAWRHGISLEQLLDATKSAP